MQAFILTVFTVVSVFASGSFALQNGLGLTPALGYNTWNDFRCGGITADHVKQVADKMVQLGLKEAGYEYVNIDDCWCSSRDSNGVLVADPNAFPNGVKVVADYVHSLGLKIGIYTDRGNKTCAGRPASAGYEAKDAATFASWGIDYLKEDSCNAPSDHNEAFREYGLMRDGLNATGRPIYFSLCGWNDWYAPVGQSLGNSWRIAGDCNKWPSVYNAIRVNEPLAKYAGPGGWNDPDMLVGSNPSAAMFNSKAQSRTQFSLWAIMAAPLLIGSSMLNMSQYDLETYSNTEILAVNQDSLGLQGTVIYNTCPPHDQKKYEAMLDAGNDFVPACQQIWARKLYDNSYAVNFVNFATHSVSVTCGTDCLGKMNFQGKVLVRDLWQHMDLGVMDTVVVSLEADGGSQTFRLFAA